MANTSTTIKFMVSSAAASLALGSAATADPLAWDGFYAGGAFNNFPDGIEMDGGYGATTAGNVGAVFAGYNKSFNSFVLGGEINAVLGDITGENRFGGDYTLSNTIDVKGKVGTTFGAALVYASVGYSFGTSDYDGIVSESFNGLNYGMGVDYLISEQFFIGAEYMVREVSDGAYLDNASLSSISIRAGYKF